jgi:protein O-GlcNAc transferase
MKMSKKNINNKNKIIENLIQQGLLLHKQGKFDSAKEIYAKILKISSGNFEALHLLGVLEIQLKNYLKSIEYFSSALTINPNNPMCYANLGIAQRNLHKLQEAITSYNHAIQLQPNYAEAYSNRGNIFKELNRPVEALLDYDRAIQLKPKYAEAYYNRALILKEQNQLNEALLDYDRAIQLKPNYAEAYYNKALIFYELARLNEAKAAINNALEINLNCLKLRWAIPFLALPPIYIEIQDIAESLTKFSEELEKLADWLTSNSYDDDPTAVGSLLPFYLAYQEINNRELLIQYGNLVNKIMLNWQTNHNLFPKINSKEGKIKLGIVGEQIRNHSVWNAITKGIIINLDSSKFEIHIFHLGSAYDRETEIAKLNCESYICNQPSLSEWVKEIIEKQIEVLLYPEIGMHGLTTQLAGLRLAPVQIVSWGHPETSGLPTIDFYLSGELYETENSEQAYSEKLVKLPNLGCTYYPIKVAHEKFDFGKYRIDKNNPILICPGTLFKYLPVNDWIWVEISKRISNCNIVFFEMQEHWTKLFRHRLEKLFIKNNLDINKFIRFLPRLNPSEFYGLLKESNVFLDTLGFSGFNTAIQAIDCELPIVTREAKFMRGRLAGGILRRMELNELIAENDAEYIDLAVRIARDQIFQNEIRQKISRQKHLVYEDREVSYALESFLLNVTRGIPHKSN